MFYAFNEIVYKFVKRLLFAKIFIFIQLLTFYVFFSSLNLTNSREISEVDKQTWLKNNLFFNVFK